MFEKMEDRVKLLKRGFAGKEIEKAYLMTNDMRIINRNVLYIKGDDPDNMTTH